MLILSGFNDNHSFPFTQLRQHIGETEWARREKEFYNPSEPEAFAERKVKELDKYDEALEKLEERKLLVDSGDMTMQEFVSNALKELDCIPRPSSFVINDEAERDSIAPRTACPESIITCGSEST